MNVVQMQLTLRERPMFVVPAGVTLRPVRLPDDVPAYLALRTVAFAGLAAPARPWKEEDYARELTDQPWWRAERCWVAECAGQTGSEEPRLVGSVVLAERRGASAALPAIHWLMVDPAWQRRGIGRALLLTALQTAWDDGQRSVVLETHRAWDAAFRVYAALGFEEAAGPGSKGAGEI